MNRLSVPSIGTVFAASSLVFAFNALSDAADVQQQAERYLDQIDVSRGVCVLVAPEPAELAQALAAQSELTVYVQLPGSDRVDAARRSLDKAGLLGTRVYVEQGDRSHIHLAGNLADAVVVAQELASAMKPHNTELLRVVRPLGKVVLGDEVLTKPFPEEADDWTHAYHGPDNNPQSTDQLARAPYITQFLAGPYYVPFPEVTVTSHGRIFKAFGHVGYKERDWPWLNSLVAFNGYNGTLLWKRPLEKGFNIHRNTLVATPDVLYVADSKSCKLLDTATGELLDEITAPKDATGPVWKWMAVVDGVLYGLAGEKEHEDETIRGDRTQAGWPWRPMTSGYDRADYAWGFGRTLFAVDLKSKEILWTQVEQTSIDGRAITMTGDRVYSYSHPHFLACTDAKSGKQLWKNSDSELLSAIGPHDKAQTPRLGFASTAYMKSSHDVVYFAGPQRSRLVAASAKDGSLLWQLPHGNYQLVLRDQGLYALGRTGPSRLLDPLTGEVRAHLDCLRGNCTRVTGTVDSIFGRGHDHAGTLRVRVSDNQPRRIAPMRPDCHDGVIAAGGMVYWGPWMCDCSLSLVGNIALAPAGDFQFDRQAMESERLQPAADAPDSLKPLPVKPGDWPTYRADNRRSATSSALIPEKPVEAWRYQPPANVDSTAPVTAGGLAFVAGSDGTVRAFDAATGEAAWKAYTAGPVLFPPTIHKNRLFAGSSDGWLYAFEAATGTQLWRFRVAPVERKISTYGKLTSTWPVASGVLVEDGVVYAAAGIASYDGTHVIALDAATGKIRWQNNSSGRLFGEDRVTGVSVQGHLLLNENKLYMAGGNVISPAVYDTANGRCLNGLPDEWGGQTTPSAEDWENPAEIHKLAAQQKKWGKAPRGCELFLVDGKVVAFDRLLYSPKQFWAGRYFPREWMQAGRGDSIIRLSGNRMVRMATGTAEPTWKTKTMEQPRAIVVGSNAVLIAGLSRQPPDGTPQGQLAAYSLEDGSQMWSHSLSAEPIWWGTAIDADGRVLVSLLDGSVVCLKEAATP
jgi:outer membrane protein assembly factor BamB